MQLPTVVRLGPALLVAALCCLSAAHQLAAAPVTGTAGDATLADWLKQGRYDEAEVAARSLLGSEAWQPAEDGRNMLRAQLVQAAVLNGHWADPAVRRLAEQLTDYSSARTSAEPEELLVALRNLGELQLRASEFDDAWQSADRLERLASRSEPPKQGMLAAALDLAARALIERQELDQALSRADRALSLLTSMADTDRSAVARTLATRSLVFLWRGDYRIARADLDRALVIRREIGAIHPETAEISGVAGLELYIAGQYVESRDVMRDALRIAEATLREGHPTIVLLLRQSSWPLRALGNLGASRTLAERALTMAEASLPDSPLVSDVLTDLAIVVQLQGDYGAALRAYERELEIARWRLGPDHMYTTTSLYNVALLLATMGDLERARPLHTQAVTSWQKRLGQDHPIVAGALWEFGQVLVEQGFSHEALPSFERAFAIRRRALPANHPDLAKTMSSLAIGLSMTSQIARSVRLSAEALAVWERGGDYENAAYADSLMAHGRVLTAAGDYAGAERAYRDAERVRRVVLGPTHPRLAETSLAIADALAAQGHAAQALKAALEGESLGRAHLRLILGYLPERQALRFVATRPRGLDLSLSLVDNSGEAAAVFDAVVKGRALVLDEMASRQRRRVAADADASLWSALSDARQRLANLVVRGADSTQTALSRTLLTEAEDEKERAERALAERSAAFRASTSQVDLGLDQVRARLPTASALLSFVRYERVTFNESKRRPRTQSSYLAFLLRSDRDLPVMVDVGDAKSLEGAVTAWRRAIESAPYLRTASDRSTMSGLRLRARIWDPFTPHLTGISRVFIVPVADLEET